MKSAKPRSHDGRTVLTGVGSLYAFIYCMLLSQELVDMPVFGGALFMCARVAVVFYATYAGPASAFLPPKARGGRTALLLLLLLANLCLVVVYPIRVDSPMMWLLFAVIICMLLRDALLRKLVQVSVSGSMEEQRFLMLLAVLQAIPLAATALLFFFSLPSGVAWPLLGGYVLCAAIELYGLMKDRDVLRRIVTPVEKEQASRTQSAVRRAHAYTAYETLSTLILVALEMTLVVIYTFLAVTAEKMLWYMVLALLCTLLSREAAEFILRRREKRGKRPDPTNLMLIGLFLWLYGIMMFSRMLGTHTLQWINVYFCLGLCSVGSALCLTCLGRMERTMQAVARFTSGGEIPGYAQMRSASLEMASLLGQMLALAALTALCLLSGKDLPRDVADIFSRFRPVMALPAVLTVLAALLSVFRFPLSSRYMEKLSSFLRLKDTGKDNPALQKQLEAVVVQRHSQPFFTKAIIALLRPCYRHTLKGVENIVQDEDNPIIFMCNHGELYGPLVSMLYIPVPIRPWAISEMCIDKQETAAYLHRYTVSRQKWLPERLKWPAARLLGAVSVWAMKQLEVIPVFRNKPRELMTTFRNSVEAMQAGDNLLIFPENPNAEEKDHGYERAGLGELFRGFPMLASIYYNKTGKCCRFLPMFAHQGMRTLNFGMPITYDPDNDPIAERDRIVLAVSDEMQRMADREEALWQAKRAKSHKTDLSA